MMIQQELGFQIEETTKAITLSPTDTLIQRKSRRWSAKSVLSGAAPNMMVAYQMGAKQMEEDVVRAMFDMCDEKEKKWSTCEDCYGCALYCRIIKIFNR